MTKSKGGHVPFEVRCRLRTPVCLNHPWVNFDGILGHLVYRRVLGRGYYDLPGKTILHCEEAESQPWVSMVTQHHGVRFSSVSFFDNDGLDSMQYFKRFHETNCPSSLRSCYVGHGYYRAWMNRFVYVKASECVFYCHGHLPTVEMLLQDLTHIGGDVRVGWGAVSSISVQETADDMSCICNGVAQRPIPVRFLRSYSDSVPLAWKCPYWDPNGVEVCVPPGARAEWA
jgi:hypothetical protein